MTKVVTYLRNSMTQHDIKIHMISESARKSLLPKCNSGRRPCRHRNLLGTMGSLETPGLFVVVLGNDSQPESVNCLRDGCKRGTFYFYTAALYQILFLFCTI